MKLTDDLESLAKLYREGALTLDEFTKAKQKLLIDERAPTPTPPPRSHYLERPFPGKETLGDAANRYVTLQIVCSIVGGILFLVFFLIYVVPHFDADPGTRIQVSGYPESH